MDKTSFMYYYNYKLQIKLYQIIDCFAKVINNQKYKNGQYWHIMFAFYIRRNTMIYVTGDLHGDINRFKDKKIKKLKKNDYLIVCGDFGFIWSGTKKENKVIKKLGKKKYNILFIEGCHENYDLLYNYPQEEWNGGKVRTISGNLRQLVRGSIFEIEGKKIFAFGGGQSADRHIRKEHNTFWEQELPSDEELINALKNLKNNNSSVDYIITHEPPSLLKDYLDIDIELIQTNQLNAAFSQIADSCKFKMWYFGKCHKNKIVSKHYHALFDYVAKVD